MRSISNPLKCVPSALVQMPNTFPTSSQVFESGCRSLANQERRHSLNTAATSVAARSRQICAPLPPRPRDPPGIRDGWPRPCSRELGAPAAVRRASVLHVHPPPSSTCSKGNPITKHGATILRSWCSSDSKKPCLLTNSWDRCCAQGRDGLATFKTENTAAPSGARWRVRSGVRGRRL